MSKEKTVIGCVLEFKKRYPFTVMWRIKNHARIVQKHLNPGERVLYAFAAQKNDEMLNLFDTAVICVTSERILIGQDKVVYGYKLNSVTPEMYNDLQVYSGLLWGRITIDTVKEVIKISNISKKALTEIETIISMYMMEAKKLYPNKDKVSSINK